MQSDFLQNNCLLKNAMSFFFHFVGMGLQLNKLVLELRDSGLQGGFACWYSLRFPTALLLE